MNAPVNADVFDNAVSTLNGTPEVSAAWVKEHLGGFDFVDVREPHELNGPLGAAEGTENVPLMRFFSQLNGRDPETPLVLICRSGRRSAMATEAAKRAGFAHVASVEGGTIEWNREVLGLHDIQAQELHANAQNLKDAIFTTSDVPEVTVHWAQQNLGRFRLIDVRQPEELASPLGAVLQAENVPLAELLDEAKGWQKDTPLVVMCRSGGRSARGAMALIRAGFTNVASMEGGMMAWRAADMPHVQY